MTVRTTGLGLLAAAVAGAALSIGGAGVASAADCPRIAGRWSDGQTVTVRSDSGYSYYQVSPAVYERAGGLIGQCAYGQLAD